MLTILINLECADERRSRMKAQLAAAGIEAVRVGVDFRESSDAEVHGWTRAHFPQLVFDLDTMCAAEAGCWASHVSAWWQLANSDQPSCRIIEDDVLLAPDFVHVTQALRRQHAFDVVYLGTSSKNISTRRRTRIDHCCVHAPIGVVFNTWGYVITRAFVQRFFGMERVLLDMPIDHFLGGRARSVKPRTGVLRPAVVSEDPAVGPHSQIQPYATRLDRHPMWQEARRAILGSKVSELYYSTIYRFL